MRRIIVTAAVGVTGFALALALAPGQAPPADEASAVRTAIDSYTAALNSGNLDGVLARIAPDADFIDDGGKQFKGKAEIAEVFKQSLAGLKGSKLTSTVTSLRLVKPDVAIVDGKAEITSPDGSTGTGRYTATWTKSGGQWLLSSVRDLPDGPAAGEPTAGPLQQLEWLVGEWASENPLLVVRLTGRWALNGSFLELDYVVKSKDGEDLAVIQYVGWDPVDGVIRSWFFDSQGGYGGGDWERDGNTWTASWGGVLPEGQIASSTNSMKFVNDNSFLFLSVDRDVDGVPLADVEAKFVRKAVGK
jgi:uncharacterized protein (TIGR02246 family)